MIDTCSRTHYWRGLVCLYHHHQFYHHCIFQVKPDQLMSPVYSSICSGIELFELVAEVFTGPLAQWSFSLSIAQLTVKKRWSVIRGSLIHVDSCFQTFIDWEWLSLLIAVGAENHHEDIHDCIKLVHKYYFGEETDYSGSVSCTADCSR